MPFARALRAPFGALHRLAGRVFVMAGLVMAVPGLGLLVQVESIATRLLDVARALFSAGLFAALVLGVRAAITRNRAAHRAWMMRAYAVGMGGATIGLVFSPITLLTGEPFSGLPSDLVFVAWWLVTIALGEWVITSTCNKEPLA